MNQHATADGQSVTSTATRSTSISSESGAPAVLRLRGGRRARYVHSLRQLLAHLGMTGAAPAAHEPAWFVEDARPQAGFL